MPVMNTRTLPSTLEYLDAAVRTYYQEEASKYETKYDKIFDVLTTDKAWVQDTPLAGLGPMRQSSEGQAVEFDTLYEGQPATYVLSKFHIGFGLTEDAKLFNRLLPLLERGTQSIATSRKHTIEMVCADLFNNAFGTKYLGGDGKAMCASDHPLLRPDAAQVSGSGSFRNRPAIDYSISEAGLEQMMIDISSIPDEAGFYNGAKPDQYIVSRSGLFEAARVLKSVGRSGTNDNDINALKAMGFLQKEPIVWEYLSSQTAHFILNTQYAGPGLKIYMHSKASGEPVTWVDNATGNTYVRSRIYLAPGWSNARAVYGSPGTAAA